jgi:hypothetical protein
MAATNSTQQSMYLRYFVYSSEEEALKTKIHGADASFGTVIVRGVPKRYTSIVTDLSKTRADALVVIKGDIRKIKYTPPSTSKRT